MTADLRTIHRRECAGGPQTTERVVVLTDATGEQHTHRLEWVEETTYRPLGDPSDAALDALAAFHDVQPDDLTLQEGGDDRAE